MNTASVNAETVVELEREVDGLGVYRLTPRTGDPVQSGRRRVGHGRVGVTPRPSPWVTGMGAPG